MQMSKVIANSSPLITLSKIGRLDILTNLFTDIVIPQAVYKEVIIEGGHKRGVSDISLLHDKAIIKVQEVQNRVLSKTLQRELDQGESEVIALALETEHDLVLLDEMEARRLAQSFGLHYTGFIGLLLKAKKSGLIHNAQQLLE
jgi:uncharacterized protein